jgi:exportin-T
MTRLIANSEPSELTEFIQFISLLVHKLNEGMSAVLNELHGPLYQHINQILSQTQNAESVENTLVESRRAYLHLLNSLFNANLSSTLTSESRQSECAHLTEH